MSKRRWLLSACSAIAASALMLAGLPVRASEADALAITANIQARHLPFGTILDPIFTLTDSDQVASYTRCGDSALWTGHYLAAEAFRYKGRDCRPQVPGRCHRFEPAGPMPGSHQFALRHRDPQ